jgi:hypothetical protein
VSERGEDLAGVAAAIERGDLAEARARVYAERWRGDVDVERRLVALLARLPLELLERALAGGRRLI